MAESVADCWHRSELNHIISVVGGNRRASSGENRRRRTLPQARESSPRERPMVKEIIGWSLIAIIPIMLGLSLTLNLNGSHKG